MKPLIVPGVRDSLSVIGTYILEAAEAAELNDKVAYRLRLAVDEIVTNIIIHGHEETQTQGQIAVRADIDDRNLTITVEDSAAPFDPLKCNLPEDLGLPLEQGQIGGLGICLALNNVDQFSYEYTNNRNHNIFVMNRPLER